jgi:hypothetical protein
MNEEQLKVIVEALAGLNVLSFALKKDGLLVVIDQAGRKLSFAPAAYQVLLPKLHKLTKVTKGAENEQLN